MSKSSPTRQKESTTSSPNGRQSGNGRSAYVSRPGLSLTADRIERVNGWGKAAASISHVFQPTTIENLKELFHLAKQSGLTVGFRGTGNSYGDAAQNGENMLISFQRMNRILDWDPDSGLIRVEPGVTLERLWQYVLGDGWWPPVATGTMRITIGGGAAMNVHGKNAWKMGPIGDHIQSFDLLLPTGETLTCSREQNSDIFHAAIGGFGMLGCFTAITLKMKRVYSGLLNVEGLAARNLPEMMSYFDQHLEDSDYLVGWLDAFARGKSLGRGQIHRAVYLQPGEDPQPAETLSLETQQIPLTMMGFFPKIWLPTFMRPFYNNVGWRAVCFAKYMASRTLEGLEGKAYQQPHAHFHFLLDAIPFNNVYGKGGMIQYQAFVPVESAEDTFTTLFEMQQKAQLPNYLSVLKRHRSDRFLMTHGLDGYSMAMDFHVTRRNRTRVIQLAQKMDDVVIEAGGRFYLAKDSTLRPEIVQAYLGAETIAQFKQIKNRCDPDGIIETNLWRRLFS